MDMPPPPTLPKKLSDLIEQAIEDAVDMPRDGYDPVFTNFHSPPQDEEKEAFPNTCFCLAGAVIVGTLQVDRNRIYGPTTAGLEFGHHARRALMALDHVREGDYEMALVHMRVAYPEDRDFSQIPLPKNSEFEGWKQFDEHIESLREVAVRLRKEGY